MEKQLIISVGRQFGSGGHEIAEKLAAHYKIQLLDHNLLDEIAAQRSVDVKNLKGLDEKYRNPFTSRTVRGYSSSPEQNLYLLQFEYLQKKAADGDSFVLVGRCGETMLKEFAGLISFFVIADKEKKIERIMNKYQLTEEAARRMIREKDIKRRRYHNSFCKGKWGDSRNYDLSINSSRLGIDGTVEVLVNYIDKRQRQ